MAASSTPQHSLITKAYPTWAFFFFFAPNLDTTSLVTLAKCLKKMQAIILWLIHIYSFEIFHCAEAIPQGP